MPKFLSPALLGLCFFTSSLSFAQEYSQASKRLGIVVSGPRTASERAAAGDGGVFVSTVLPGSFAATIDLHEGALIVEINRQPIKTEAAYRAVISHLKVGDDVVFVVRDMNSGGKNSYIGGTLNNAAQLGEQNGTESAAPASNDLEAQALAHLNGGSAPTALATGDDLEAQALAHLGGSAPSGPPATGADLEAQALQAMKINEIEAEKQRQREEEQRQREIEERAEQSNAAAMAGSQPQTIGTTGGGGFLNALNGMLGAVNNGLDAQIAQQNARNAELQARANAQVAANNARREREAEQQRLLAEQRQQAEQRQSSATSSSSNSRLCNSAQGSQGLLAQGCGGSEATSDVAGQGRSVQQPTQMAANVSSPKPATTYNPNLGSVPTGVSTGTAAPADCVYLSASQPCVSLAQYQAQQSTRVPVQTCPPSGFVPGLMRRTSSDTSAGVPCTPGQPLNPSLFASGGGTGTGGGSGSAAPGGGYSDAGSGGTSAGGPYDPDLNQCVVYSYKKDPITGDHLILQNNCTVSARIWYYASPQAYGADTLAPGEATNTYASHDAIIAAGVLSIYACPSADIAREPDGTQAFMGANNRFLCSRK
ncbi:PDZ domain-containing protein [Granulicella sp. WH15]|uniref:PDZ domain-containing protein n=1 Tax=Granulicella sp. WH15 TaxID=2602070 RepID=UPI0013A5920D|nr:PDZ domain-containing protein [Granulicella sp. WH15]